MSSEDPNECVDDDYWNDSAIEKQANVFSDERSVDEMCGVSLGGITQLAEQVKVGVGKIAGSVSSSTSEEAESADLYEQLSAEFEKILTADNFDLPFSIRSFPTKDEELDMLRRYYESRWSPPSIESIITASLLGKPYSLEQYKSLKIKKELLKAAETSGDGDLILNIVLFLNRTLTKKLFNDILLAHPIATQHYINYLSTTKQITLAADTLEMLGRSKDAAMMLFTEACVNPQRMLPRLRVCLRNHFNEGREKTVLTSAIRLLEWQEGYKGGALLGSSVSICLLDLCDNHWGASETSSHSPISFKNAHSVTDRLYQWSALKARSKQQAWPDIDAIFLTMGWLGEKKVKTDLPMEEVVTCLCKFGAPQTLLSFYLGYIDDLDKRLALAKKLQCHRSAIEIFIAQKDRMSLSHYKANLVPHSEEYVFAEKTLKSASIKWKN